MQGITPACRFEVHDQQRLELTQRDFDFVVHELSLRFTSVTRGRDAQHVDVLQDLLSTPFGDELFGGLVVQRANSMLVKPGERLDPPLLRDISHLDDQILVELLVQIRRAVAPWIAQHTRALDRFVVAGAMCMAVDP